MRKLIGIRTALLKRENRGCAKPRSVRIITVVGWSDIQMYCSGNSQGGVTLIHTVLTPATKVKMKVNGRGLLLKLVNSQGAMEPSLTAVSGQA